MHKSKTKWVERCVTSSNLLIGVGFFICLQTSAIKEWLLCARTVLCGIFKNLFCCSSFLQMPSWHKLLSLISWRGIIKKWQGVLSAGSWEFTASVIKLDWRAPTWFLARSGRWRWRSFAKSLDHHCVYRWGVIPPMSGAASSGQTGGYSLSENSKTGRTGTSLLAR